MNLLKKLGTRVTASTRGESERLYWIAVRCQRCGEIVRTRINLSNDLSAEYGENGTTTYICRKVMIGKQRCFQPIEVTLTFDANHRLIDRQVTGGEFVTE